jgi:hypothetical protein
VVGEFLPVAVLPRVSVQITRLCFICTPSNETVSPANAMILDTFTSNTPGSSDPPGNGGGAFKVFK